MQFHGFVEIRTLPKVMHDCQKAMEIAQAMQEDVNAFENAKFVELNGDWFFVAHGNYNHASAFKPMRDILEKLIVKAPGSYGLFYILDDEDEVVRFRDVYRVLIIRRGVIIEGVDTFLSPLTPVVQDPFNLDELS